MAEAGKGEGLQGLVEQLKQQVAQGVITEAQYREVLETLGLAPDAAVLQVGQVVGEQTNIAIQGDGNVLGDGSGSRVNKSGAATAPGVQEHDVSTSGSAFDQRSQQVGQQINVAGDYINGDPGTDPEALCRSYLSRLMGQTQRLPLGGVDPQAVQEKCSSDVPLAAVYTALLTRHAETDEVYAGIPKGGLPQRGIPRGGLPKVPPLSALETLNREKYLVLLGEPGSGKSTFVNFVALCLAGQHLGDAQANLAALTTPLPEPRSGREAKPRPQPWDHGALLPVRVVLRDFVARGLPETRIPVDGGALWTFIAAELGESLKEYAPHLKQYLLEQGGLILLDGLDEVPDAHHCREQVKAAIEGFVRDFPACRFLVTSRTYAYQRQDWKLHDFAEVVLAPFSPVQITAFVDRWYAHVGSLRGMTPQDVQGKAQRLKEALERSPRLTELAERPLLLTWMASLHAWRGGSLPEKREELYADAVDLLLEQWERCKIERDSSGKPLMEQPALAEWLKVGQEVVRVELDRLAFEAHRDQGTLEGTADIPQERLVGALLAVAANPQAKANPLELMGYLCDRAGLLVARGEGVYAFPHRTFQEYLAACHLTDHAFPSALVELLRGDPQRWREATLLAGAKAARGTASAVWNLAEALCYREPPQTRAVEADCWGALLAAQVLLENVVPHLAQVAEWDAPKLQRVQRWMKAIMERGWLPPVDRALAGEALAVLGDDRDLDTLVGVPAGPFLMGSSDRDEIAQDREKPQHEVVLSAFKIGKYPVTNAQYWHFVEATGREWWWGEIRPERASHPAGGISWYDAQAYCAWLTQVWREEGKIGAEEVVRLPTEAEWEKAARGTDGRIYPWGNEWDAARCNTSEWVLDGTTSVGMFPKGASPYGCLDMAGNVFEWTGSLWGKERDKPNFKYPYDSADGRENLEAGSDILRVMRGGSFLYDLACARCACRYGGLPFNFGVDVGFRVVSLPYPPLR
ncbi:MAG: SUMF1/EgtB/PvdO family nonheme iron enzyme [Anaerolineae bacterium]|jgi:formylglycine-generating enzyme required for sulfatase activity|nr:SUMF1/EgtB/PvdO family nonheme iron enzyme [Anaerolineae bacterium]